MVSLVRDLQLFPMDLKILTRFRFLLNSTDPSNHPQIITAAMKSVMVLKKSRTNGVSNPNNPLPKQPTHPAKAEQYPKLMVQ